MSGLEVQPNSHWKDLRRISVAPATHQLPSRCWSCHSSRPRWKSTVFEACAQETFAGDEPRMSVSGQTSSCSRRSITTRDGQPFQTPNLDLERSEHILTAPLILRSPQQNVDPNSRHHLYLPVPTESTYISFYLASIFTPHHSPKHLFQSTINGVSSMGLAALPTA